MRGRQFLDEVYAEELLDLEENAKMDEMMSAFYDTYESSCLTDEKDDLEFEDPLWENDFRQAQENFWEGETFFGVGYAPWINPL